MVVAVAQVQRERLARGFASRFQQSWLELFFKEFVGRALVYEDAAWKLVTRLHELGGVVRRPGCAIRAEITGECLHTPRALDGRGDRRECRQRAVLAGV